MRNAGQSGARGWEEVAGVRDPFMLGTKYFCL
jgi:hypothetical protein